MNGKDVANGTHQTRNNLILSDHKININRKRKRKCKTEYQTRIEVISTELEDALFEHKTFKGDKFKNAVKEMVHETLLQMVLKFH